MDSADVMELMFSLVIGVCVVLVAFVLVNPYLSGEKQAAKRIQGVAESVGRRVARRSADSASQNSAARAKKVKDTLKEIEDRQKAKEKISMRLRLDRAGFDSIEPKAFYIASLVIGACIAVVVLVGGSAPPVVLAAGFAGALGVPRYVLFKLTVRRQKKFLSEFANAIDIIVRGVKSGLPLNECLGIIARECPSPICDEFAQLVDQQRVGVPLSECFDRMMTRMPLNEVKFFAIVLAIQQQAGGNLSEALGNLSGVLRDRKMLEGKVKALSAEAKYSAYILGGLPFVVILMIYMSTPEYISKLWTERMGQFILAAAGVLYTSGILVMRKMINFKY